LIVTAAIGAVFNSSILDLLKAFATPITTLLIALFVTGELEKQKCKDTEEQNRQEALKNYLTQMTSLLVDKELSKQSHDKPIVIAARALTLSLMSELDEKRNRQLIEFLSNAELIQNSVDNTSPNLLRGTNLSECMLENCNFSSADIRYCNFSRADLRGCDFSSTDLRGCDFSGAKLNKANFRFANLEYAKFTDANLSEAILDNIICNSQTDFKNVILLNAQLSYISELPNLKGASIDQANLAYIKISDTDLTAKDLIAKDLSATDSSFVQVTFENVVLSKSNFSFTRMEKVQFINNTILEYSNISNSSLYEVIFVGAKLNNADFTDSSFDKVDFSNANLNNANFRNANFIQFVNLKNANLEYANLENVDLSSAILDRTILKKSNLSGANLNNINLESAELIGTTYTKNHPQIPDTIFPDNFDPQAAEMKRRHDY
jgi:uncharacterized protein YjbI with pentapeptide repeats